jgi:hypothetical protein
VAFPDPSTSPAHYAKTLFIGSSEVVTAADAEAGSWIRGFYRVVHLVVDGRAVYPDPDEPIISLVPFHGLSSAIKSLRVVVSALPSSCVFDLILSFPLLENLAVIVHEELTDSDDGLKEDGAPTAIQPPSPPVFTGSLELYLKGGMTFTRRLLCLPGGIHFRKLTLTRFREEDCLMVMALVEECSHTLEFLDITWGHLRKSTRHQRPHLYLNHIPSRTGVNLGRPL